MRAYKNAAFCLQDFVEIVDRKDDPGNAAPLRLLHRHGRRGPGKRIPALGGRTNSGTTSGLYERLGQAKRDDDGSDPRDLGRKSCSLSCRRCRGFMRRNSLRHKWAACLSGWLGGTRNLLLGARRQLKECDGRPIVDGSVGQRLYEALMTVTEMAGRLADRLLTALSPQVSLPAPRRASGGSGGAMAPHLLIVNWRPAHSGGVPFYCTGLPVGDASQSNIFVRWSRARVSAAKAVPPPKTAVTFIKPAPGCSPTAARNPSPTPASGPHGRRPCRPDEVRPSPPPPRWKWGEAGPCVRPPSKVWRGWQKAQAEARQAGARSIVPARAPPCSPGQH